MHTADVVVVGGGSAGAAVTRRLVDAGADVLLLEAGGPDDLEAIHDPARSHELWDSEADWGYRTVPQADANGRRLHLPRGRVLGGSSCLNGMIWTRGAAADYDGWARFGCTGWGWQDVEPVFRQIEDYDVPAPHRGSGGPLAVCTRWEPDPVHAAIVGAAQEAGVPFNPDYNDGSLEGVSYVQLNIRNGRRHSSAAAYLRPIDGRPQLEILTGAHVRRLLLERGRCTGVEWQRGGAVERATAAEVIVSAGAIGSPRLLLLSGIGPAEELRTLGIAPVADLRGVGRNLHDHLLVPVIFATERDVPPPSPGLPPIQSHLFAHSRPGLALPDIQPIHFGVPLYESWMDGPPHGCSLMAGMIRPASRGRVTLAGAAPEDGLRIDLGALTCAADVEALEAAVELCRSIGAQPALRDWGARELYPGPELAAGDLRNYVRATAITYHHQVGTCRMGVDADAVVDPTLQVHGLAGLRVADASVMPLVTTGNTHAPAVMIGERAADFVLADAL